MRIYPSSQWIIMQNLTLKTLKWKGIVFKSHLKKSQQSVKQLTITAEGKPQAKPTTAMLEHILVGRQ